eukprot:366413-Chlamydomonas_euryale.AAC.4
MHCQEAREQRRKPRHHRSPMCSAAHGSRTAAARGAVVCVRAARGPAPPPPPPLSMSSMRSC